tara:strand:+ start:687 stop:1484 length:798 start_codon:yes stop_codon:yes gene_type:complete
MYTITINHRDKPVTYDILTSSEAIQDNIAFKYWREADSGDYAISDDDVVAKLIKRTSYKNGSTYFRFPWGYCICKDVNKSFKLFAENRQTKHTFTGKPWLKVHKKQLLGDMSMVYAMTRDKEKTIEMVHGKDVSDSNKRKYRRWMKSEVFTDMVREETEKLLKKHDLDEDYTMELMKKAIDIAKEKKDVSNLLRVVENLQDLHGMNEKVVTKTTESLEAVQTRKMLESLEEEEKRLLVTQTVEETSNGVSKGTISQGKKVENKED